MTAQPPPAAAVLEQVAEMLYALDHSSCTGGLSVAPGWQQRQYRGRADALADAGLLALSAPAKPRRVSGRASPSSPGSSP